MKKFAVGFVGLGIAALIAITALTAFPRSDAQAAALNSAVVYGPITALATESGDLQMCWYAYFVGPGFPDRVQGSFEVCPVLTDGIAWNTVKAAIVTETKALSLALYGVTIITQNILVQPLERG